MTTPAAPDTPAPPPLVGAAAQVEALARCLLAMRSNLEAIIDLTGKTPATKVAHATCDQLDAAFVIVTALQATADLTAAAASIEPATPTADMKRPPTFGAKRRAATADAGGGATIPKDPSHG